MAAAEAAQPAYAGADYDEAQCIAALARLEQLKNQLNDLRLTLPRIVEPFHMPSKPPMFHAFKDTLVKSQRDMKTFKALWQSPETQDILEHTRKSATANPDLSEGAQVPQYGWIEKEAREKEAEKNKGEVDEVMEDTRAHISKDERERVLAQWKKTNPLIKVEEGPEGREIRISFAADSTKYRFRVVFPDDVNATSTPKAECEGVGEPFAGVTRCLASRPNLNDLKYLLDMIGAYKTVKGLRCAKCNRMLDDDATKPLARRNRQMIGVNETPEIIWEPLHEGCLD